MLDFTPLRVREIKISQLTADLTLEDLRRLTDEMIDQMLSNIADCNDAQVSLALWPGEPHLDNRYEPWAGIGEVNAVGRFVLGLWHDDDHLAQIGDIVQQAKVDRA
jgi:hypothetical protein